MSPKPPKPKVQRTKKAKEAKEPTTKTNSTPKNPKPKRKRASVQEKNSGNGEMQDNSRIEGMQDASKSRKTSVQKNGSRGSEKQDTPKPRKTSVQKKDSRDSEMQDNPILDEQLSIPFCVPANDVGKVAPEPAEKSFFLQRRIRSPEVSIPSWLKEFKKQISLPRPKVVLRFDESRRFFRPVVAERMQDDHIPQRRASLPQHRSMLPAPTNFQSLMSQAAPEFLSEFNLLMQHSGPVVPEPTQDAHIPQRRASLPQYRSILPAPTNFQSLMSQAGLAFMPPHHPEPRRSSNAYPPQHLELEVPDFSHYFEEYSKRFGSGRDPMFLQTMGTSMFNLVAEKFKITKEIPRIEEILQETFNVGLNPSITRFWYYVVVSHLLKLGWPSPLPNSELQQQFQTLGMIPSGESQSFSSPLLSPFQPWQPPIQPNTGFPPPKLQFQTPGMMPPGQSQGFSSSLLSPFSLQQLPVQPNTGFSPPQQQLQTPRMMPPGESQSFSSSPLRPFRPRRQRVQADTEPGLPELQPPTSMLPGESQGFSTSLLSPFKPPQRSVQPDTGLSLPLQPPTHHYREMAHLNTSFRGGRLSVPQPSNTRPTQFNTESPRQSLETETTPVFSVKTSPSSSMINSVGSMNNISSSPQTAETKSHLQAPAPTRPLRRERRLRDDNGDDVLEWLRLPWMVDMQDGLFMLDERRPSQLANTEDTTSMLDQRRPPPLEDIEDIPFKLAR